MWPNQIHAGSSQNYLFTAENRDRWTAIRTEGGGAQQWLKKNHRCICFLLLLLLFGNGAVINKLHIEPFSGSYYYKGEGWCILILIIIDTLLNFIEEETKKERKKERRKRRKKRAHFSRNHVNQLIFFTNLLHESSSRKKMVTVRSLCVHSLQLQQ